MRRIQWTARNVKTGVQSVSYLCLCLGYCRCCCHHMLCPYSWLHHGSARLFERTFFGCRTLEGIQHDAIGAYDVTNCVIFCFKNEAYCVEPLLVRFRILNVKMNRPPADKRIQRFRFVLIRFTYLHINGKINVILKYNMTPVRISNDSQYSGIYCSATTKITKFDSKSNYWFSIFSSIGELWKDMPLMVAQFRVSAINCYGIQCCRSTALIVEKFYAKISTLQISFRWIHLWILATENMFWMASDSTMSGWCFVSACQLQLKTISFIRTPESIRTLSITVNNWLNEHTGIPQQQSTRSDVVSGNALSTGCCMRHEIKWHVSNLLQRWQKSVINCKCVKYWKRTSILRHRSSKLDLPRALKSHCSVQSKYVVDFT